MIRKLIIYELTILQQTIRIEQAALSEGWATFVFPGTV